MNRLETFRHSRLEIDEDLTFQAKSWRIQRYGWTAFGLFLVFVVAGATGDGPAADKQLALGPHTAMYKSQAPAGSETKIRFVIHSPEAASARFANNKTVVELHGDLIHLEDWKFFPSPTAIQRQPLSIRATFENPRSSGENSAPMLVDVSFLPLRAGEQRLQLAVAQPEQTNSGELAMWIVP
jgi:hypothetical protein